jgi:hypothetical protein
MELQTNASIESNDLAARIVSVTGRTPVAWVRASGGYSVAERWIVRFADGSSVFVKGAVEEQTAQALRAEHRFYRSVQADFLPRLLGWDDNGEKPILLLENLSEAHWPPPWSVSQIRQVLLTLERVALLCVVPDIPRLEERRPWLSGWTVVAEDPNSFLGLGLCTGAWLVRALPDLLSAQATANLDGGDLIHFDIRSDNLCFHGDRTILVDWNGACLGERRFDLARWLPSLHVEGGPQPEEILPDGAAYAALLSGFWASRAGRPPGRRAPHVRPLQLRLLIAALEWAIRSLGLPHLDPRDG